MNLTDAVLDVSRLTGVAKHIVTAMVVEEIRERTGVTLRVADGPARREAGGRILLGTVEAVRESMGRQAALLQGLSGPGPEGYLILSAEGSAPAVFVAGSDGRGVLYGAGRLLRLLHLRPGSVLLPGPVRISSTPRHSIRGHQLGYRPKTNAYDAWSVQQFARYIRELAIFGANSIEILPPRTDDDATGPLMQVPPMEMMVRLSEILDDHGMDVWIWYPNMGQDYGDPACRERELAERREIFGSLRRIDHVFIPGGDPGNMEPGTLFHWAAQVAGLLQRHHPNARVWLSPQTFRQPKSWLDSFVRQANARPDWLGGVVHGPWVRVALPELRGMIHEGIPIRRYPDITHSYVCQYPVPEWDPAFAMTLGRECINPRPAAEKHIHNLFHEHAAGSVSYSEGINDDVNKFVWSDQDWDPETPVLRTLQEYAGFFIDIDHAEELARGILALEENFHGPLAVNGGVEVTLRQWMDLERALPAAAGRSYRFQMCLLRACYDAYLRRRLIHDTETEQRVYDALEPAAPGGSLAILEKAEAILKEGRNTPVRAEWRHRCVQLADSLFHSIGAQLSVGRHQAIAWNRGAFLDAIDIPLNDYEWLLDSFGRIRAIDDEQERQRSIHRIVHRRNPGPGGFYDSFGTPPALRRLANPQDWTRDPGGLASTIISFATPLLYRTEVKEAKGICGEEYGRFGPIPLAWIGNATTLYDTPLEVRYKDLSPQARYRLRVTYIGVVYIRNFGPNRVRLAAGGGILVHDFLDVTRTCAVAEYDIPAEAVRDGILELSWTTPDGDQGPNIAELWLMKTRSAENTTS
jgi:hypothetical protein